MAEIADAVTPYTCPPAFTVTVPVAQALPVPPLAWGFTEAPEIGLVIEGITTHITGAVNPAGPYLEKRKGQIWPR